MSPEEAKSNAIIDDMATQCGNYTAPSISMPMPTFSGMADILKTVAKKYLPDPNPLPDNFWNKVFTEMVNPAKGFDPATIVSGMTEVITKAISATTPKPPSTADLVKAAKDALHAIIPEY